MSDVVFEKHDYSKPVKRKIQLLENCDPRPPELRGNVSDLLPALLQKNKGQQLCVSLLFDESCQQWDGGSISEPTNYHLPDISTLKSTVTSFKESLVLSDEKIRQIEMNTRDQRLSPL